MKLLIQSDDYGITEGVAAGIIKGIKDGVIRNTGMFTNMPSSKKAAEMIKDIKEVCVGIDINYVAGKPAADPKLVPSLIKDNGFFYSSRERRQMDKECESGDHLNYEEAKIEAKAQIDRFVELMGRKPEYLHGHAYGCPTISRIHEELSEEYGIGMTMKMLNDNNAKRCESWYTVPFSEEDQKKVDTTKFITTDQGQLLGHEIGAIISHCGYIDNDLYPLTSFTVIRVKDLACMVSDEIKQWIKDNNIELITYRDLAHNPQNKS